MLNPDSPLARLINTPMREGRLIWIGLRPARRVLVTPVPSAELEAGLGLVGDRYSHAGGARQVTLVEAEALAALASHLGQPAVDPRKVRRNLVTQGINLFALKDRQFRVGGALLEASGECHPCSRMEETLGVGGYNAFRGLGGITARVIHGGLIMIGDGIGRADE